MVSTNCTTLGSSFDHCLSVSLDAKEDGKKYKRFVKSCFTKALCDTGRDAYKNCKYIDAAICEFSCCDTDNCNGGTMAAVSVTLMVACAFLAMFR